MSIIKMRSPIDVLFAFKIFSLPVPTRPGTRTFWPTRPVPKSKTPTRQTLTRSVEAKSLNVGKSLRIGKSRKNRI